MVELLRTNDLVKLSFLGAVLRDGGIEPIVLDQHMSVLEGSAGAIPRRSWSATRTRTRRGVFCARWASSMTEIESARVTSDTLLGGRGRAAAAGGRLSGRHRSRSCWPLRCRRRTASVPSMSAAALAQGRSAWPACDRPARHRDRGGPLLRAARQGERRAQRTREAPRHPGERFQAAAAETVAEELRSCLREPALLRGELATNRRPPAPVRRQRWRARPDWKYGSNSAPGWSARAVRSPSSIGRSVWPRFSAACLKPAPAPSSSIRFGLIIRSAGRAAKKTANRIIVQATAEHGGPLQLASGMILHDADGTYAHTADRVLRGGGALALMEDPEC